MQSFDKQISDEFAQLLKKADVNIKESAINLRGVLQDATPEDTGELRQSWEMPKKLSDKHYRITNTQSEYADVIDGGRRQAIVNGVPKMVGSEQLPNGFDPIIQQFEAKLQKDINK